jgi:hypothetical protein
MKLIIFLLPTLIGSLSAGTINLFSSANTTNNSGSATVAIDPNSAWQAALPSSNWISFGPTGSPSSPGYFVVPNGTTIMFSQSFNIDGPVTAASLSVMADDTTSVILNGTTIFAATDLGAGGYPRCSAQPIGCLTSTRADIDMAALSPYFKMGSNTLSFGVEQKNAVSFGLDYAGSITSAPEPVSFALIGAGLASFALLRRSGSATRRDATRS